MKWTIGQTNIYLHDMQMAQYYCTLFLDQRKLELINTVEGKLVGDIYMELNDKKYKSPAQSTLQPLLKSRIIIQDATGHIYVNHSRVAFLNDTFLSVANRLPFSATFEDITKYSYNTYKCLAREFRLDVLSSINNGLGLATPESLLKGKKVKTESHINDLVNQNLVHKKENKRLVVNNQVLEHVVDVTHILLNKLKE